MISCGTNITSSPKPTLTLQQRIRTTYSMATTTSSSPSPNDYGEMKEVTIDFTGEDNGVTREHDQTLWRDSSYDFSQDAMAKGIGDFGFVTDSPSPQRSSLSKIPESPNTYGVLTPRGVRVSFNEVVQRRSNASNAVGASDEVVLCSSNASFRRKSTLLATKSKSRLMDPPGSWQDQRSQTFLRSTTFTGKGVGSEEIDDDDTCWEDDLPTDYKRLKFSKWTILELVSLIMLIGALVCSLTIPYMKKKKLFELEYWKWEIMILVLICGRLVSGWVIRIVVFLIERNFLLRKRVLYFVYGLRNGVQNCIWLSLVLIAWQCIFDKRVERITNGQVLPYVTKIWICLLVGTLVWLLKTLFVKALASSFHVSTFFDRIHESLFNQYVIETLSGPPSIEIEHQREEEDRVIAEVQKLQSAGATIPLDLKANIFQPKSGTFIATPRKSSSMLGRSPRISRMMSKKEDEGITLDHLHRLNQKNVSAWNMKRLMKIIRKGVISTLDEQLQAESTNEDESSVQITSEYQAKAAAKKIFNNVAQLGSNLPPTFQNGDSLPPSTAQALAGDCNSLIDYRTPNTTTLAAVGTLFNFKNFRTLLGANNLPLSTPQNFIISANQTLKITFTCIRRNDIDVSNHQPLYRVVSGDGLYHIAVEVFSGLMEYPRVQEVNNISDPNLIFWKGTTYGSHCHVDGMRWMLDKVSVRELLDGG